jgi:plastocyanin
MISKIRQIAFACFCCLPLNAIAETWDVTVGNNFFSPNDLTIQVGDTVRWTNNSGFHDVTADNGSWASQTASSFTYSRTFNSVEEVLYHCSVHSEPGRNIQTSMNGRINVVAPQQSGFQINAGISDAWDDPLTKYQGFFIIVWEDIQYIFLSWFTYDTERPPQDVTAVVGEPGHRWLTAQGPYEGDTATLDIYLSSGGLFNTPEPEPPVTSVDPVGTMTIVWSDCENGLLSYDMPDPGLSGDIELTRIHRGNVPACEAAQPPPQ